MNCSQHKPESRVGLNKPRGGAPRTTTKKADPKPQPRLDRLHNTRRLTQAPCTSRARPHPFSCLATCTPRTRTHFTPQKWLLSTRRRYRTSFPSTKYPCVERMSIACVLLHNAGLILQLSFHIQHTHAALQDGQLSECPTPHFTFPSCPMPSATQPPIMRSPPKGVMGPRSFTFSPAPRLSA